jgi:hypothetical protein
MDPAWFRHKYYWNICKCYNCWHLVIKKIVLSIKEWAFKKWLCSSGIHEATEQPKPDLCSSLTVNNFVWMRNDSNMEIPPFFLNVLSLNSNKSVYVWVSQYHFYSTTLLCLHFSPNSSGVLFIYTWSGYNWEICHLSSWNVCN